jgi:hypothetical protein
VAGTTASDPLRERDAVATETPAAAATCRIVVVEADPSGAVARLFAIGEVFPRDVGTSAPFLDAVVAALPAVRALTA